MVPDDAWLAGLRAVLRKIANENVRLVVGEKTAGADLIRHLATRLAIPFEVIASTPSFVDEANGVPTRDRIVVAAADTVYVLSLRTRGNLHRLLRKYLGSPDDVYKVNPNATSDIPSDPVGRPTEFHQALAPQIVFVDLPGLQANAARQELCQLGARIWQPTADQFRPLEGSPALDEWHMVDTSTRATDAPYLIVPFPHGEGWDFLTHTTRSCPGPWPEQSFEVYADGLFESRPDSDHSALATLRRIVRQRRLIASGRTIREGHRVVSFTACPLEQLPSLHQFRPHRVRWDFEPYGICIRKEWLQTRGVRPSTYGTSNDWKRLPDADRPLFQLATGKSGIDWTVEREWRHVGDLDLSELTAADVLLFVPNFEAVQSLAQVTDWPVTLWPGSPEQS